MAGRVMERVTGTVIAARPLMRPLLRLIPPLRLMRLPLTRLLLTLRLRLRQRQTQRPPATLPAAASDAAAAASDAAASNAATDAAATDAAATDVAAIDNTAVDPTTVTVDPPSLNAVETQAPTDPTTITVTPELAAIMSIPTTDPRGGEEVAPAVTNGVPGGAAPALGGPGAAPVDVAINAVIVSAAQSPWDAIRRAPGVRNVIVTGGIIALGKTPIPGEIPGGGPQPAWLRLIPDLRLLNGSAIPPVVPNVIDVRIVNFPITIDAINNRP